MNDRIWTPRSEAEPPNTLRKIHSPSLPFDVRMPRHVCGGAVHFGTRLADAGGHPAWFGLADCFLGLLPRARRRRGAHPGQFSKAAGGPGVAGMSVGTPLER